MRKPLRAKAAIRQQISRIVSMSAPVNGWNARDSEAEMKPGDAIKLKNWWPTTTDCVIRGGAAEHATSTTGTVKSLAVHNAMTGTSKMFAATASGVYDASSAGAVGASVATSTNAYWQSVNFGDGTTNWLIMVNGVDKPNYYSGSTWTAVDGVSTPALTGLTTTLIIGVFVHKGRLYFIEKDSLSVWYLAAGAAGGALTEFDFASIAKKGGYLAAGGTWSIDAGDGVNDYAVFVTSEGEVIVYSGTNPSSATTWALVGVYDIGKPLGRRCLTKVGGDLVILTQNGAFPLSSVLQSSTIDKRLAITNRIEKAFSEASRTYGSLVGWEGVFYPAQSAVIFNIPTVEGSEAKQYAMNTSSPRKPWCEFDGWDATCFAVFNGDLYFGVGSEVKKAWTGAADDGAAIVTEAKEAFNRFGIEGQKECTLYRPILRVSGNLTYATGMDVDFKETSLVATATHSVTSTGALWDVADWDEGYWAANLDLVRIWRSPRDNIGTWFAGKLNISTDSLEVHWIATDVMLKLGAGI